MAPPAFPPEIHSLIIRFATYTPVYFDSPDPQYWPVDGELYSGIAADYTTKKALMLVSRQFRRMSLPYLYEVVEVHKSSNMHRLAEVLDMRSSENTSSGQQNPRKIVHLFVSVLETNDGRGKLAVFNSLGRVLTRCRSLQGFGLLDAAPYTLDTPCDWWISIPKGIRFADWHGSIMACDFAQMIDGISESLMALRISKSPYQTSSPRVSLPRLTHLSILEGIWDH
ncbi:hypothetical protein BD410DRAFT_447676 [Rickenella mellea]|uniref:F-box domain-containing protein n=1 Tax=Rickenella mellea TaxID=50990 RepID=A0A4Y7PVV1_9AGAM|nr:hypothetical protein BD410DRAFT_447676 [Rickenella mellea]